MMKRSLPLIAAVATLALILGGNALLGASTPTKAAGPIPINMASYPGNSPSGVTGTTTITDSGPNVVGSAVAHGIASYYPAVAAFYFTGQNCNPTTLAAVLVYHFGAGDQQVFLVDGVTLDAGATLLDLHQSSAYLGGAASINSAALSDLTGYGTSTYRVADEQFLACGNVDGSPVTGWDGWLDDQHRLRSAQPPSPCFDNLGDPFTCLQIDMVQDGTTTDGKPVWCQSIEPTATHTVGATYQVAICLTNSPIASGSPAGFNFNLVYDDAMNACVDRPCGSGSDPYCLDADPDANTGTTIFGNSTAGAAIGLGTVGWTCAINDSLKPACDKNTGAHGPGKGKAFLECLSTTATQPQLTLPVGAGVSAPIAVLSFQANGGGTDTLKLDQVSVIQKGSSEIVACVIGDDMGRCYNGTDIKVTPTPRPGVGGVVKLPSADLATDSNAPSDDSGWPAGAHAGLAGAGAAAVIVLGAGGWYARRRRLL